MSKKSTEFYSQCTLLRTENNKLIRTVSYIPSKFAFINRVVSLLGNDDKWSDWTVVSVGEKKPAEYVEKHADDYRDYRKNTDI